MGPGIPILSAPLEWSALWLLCAMWVVLFAAEVVMTAFDGEGRMYVAGWVAFRIGCGLCIPVWAYAMRSALPLVVHHDQWWHHWWTQLAFLAVSVVVSLYVWFGGPIQAKGEARVEAWREARLPSKIWFQVWTVWVGYLLIAGTAAVGYEAIRRLAGPGLPRWAIPWLVVMVVFIAIYAWANVHDNRHYVFQGKRPAPWVLVHWGIAMIALLSLRYLPDAWSMLSGGITAAFIFP